MNIYIKKRGERRKGKFYNSSLLPIFKYTKYQSMEGLLEIEKNK